MVGRTTRGEAGSLRRDANAYHNYPQRQPGCRFRITLSTVIVAASTGVLIALAVQPTQYLGYGAGTDFDRKIVVKVNAPKLLRNELMKPSWKGDEIVFSFTSDPYIPLEAHYKLTRQCLEICAEFRQPLGIITKSALIRKRHRRAAATRRETRTWACSSRSLYRSRGCTSCRASRAFTDARFCAMADLAAAADQRGHRHSARHPGLSSELPILLKRAKEAGATTSLHQHAAITGQRRALF